MAYFNNFSLFQIMSMKDNRDTEFKSKMPPLPHTPGYSRPQADFYSPILKAAYDKTSEVALGQEPTPALPDILEEAFGVDRLKAEKDLAVIEADSLKNQVDDLSNQFAAERSAYELLLDMEKASSPAVEELCEKLGQQKGRVGHLQKQLDQVIEKLTSLQEEVDISDSDADESALPFGQDNERDTEIGEVLQPPVETSDQSPAAAQEEHSTTEAEPPIQLQLHIAEPAIMMQLHVAEPPIIVQLQMSEPLHDHLAEEHAQLKQAFKLGQEQLQDLQEHFQQVVTENYSLSAQLESRNLEVERLSSSSADAEMQLADCRVAIQEMEEDIEENGLAACEHDLLLRQCLEVAKAQQELDVQLQQLEVHHSTLAKDATAVEDCHQALDSRMHLLNAAERDLGTQQSLMSDQLLQVSESEERVETEAAQLQLNSDALKLQEEALERDRAILLSQTQRLDHAAEAKSAELEAKSQQLAELAAQATKEQSAEVKPAHKPSKASAQQPAKKAQPRPQPLASLAKLEQRQQELESQKAHLQAKHRQLAEDLSSKQMGLNQQWAALDIDQSKAEARERELKLQTTELQSQWEILEGEWSALEIEKAQAVHFSTPSESLPEPSQGSYQSCHSESGTEASEATAVVRLSEQEVEQWRSSLEKQLSDVAVEWAAVNTERTKLKAGWDALRAREGANTKAEASTLLESCDPFSLREEDAPQSIGQILDRGDSPRDLKERKQWHNSSEGYSSEASKSKGTDTEENSSDAQLNSVDSESSTCGFTYIKSRAEKLRDERTKLWAAASNPNEMSKRLQKIKETEQLQAQREMMLQVKEAVDISQLEEMNMSRSLALDSREKALQQREKDQKEAFAKTFSRDEEVNALRRRLWLLESRLQEAVPSEYDTFYRRCTSLGKKKSPWAKTPERGSLLDPLWQQGLDVEEVYRSGDNLNQHHSLKA